MLNLINDLLDVTRIESGHLDLKVRAGDWVEFVRHNADLNGALAARRGVAIEVDIDAAGPFVIPFDPNRMEQVLNNLLGNAVKFSPAGSRIVVRVRREGESVRTSVIDSGPGHPGRGAAGALQTLLPRQRPAARRASAARGWGCRSPGGSSRRTGGDRRRERSRAAGPPSGSRCRPQGADRGRLRRPRCSS